MQKRRKKILNKESRLKKIPNHTPRYRHAVLLDTD